LPEEEENYDDDDEFPSPRLSSPSKMVWSDQSAGKCQNFEDPCIMQPKIIT